MYTASTRPSHLLKEFDRPLYVGSWFGFLPVEAPKVTAEDLELVSEFGTDPILLPSLRAAYLRSYMERNLSALPQPLSLSYRFRRDGSKRPEYVFELSGFSSGAAEALLIRTALSVLEDQGKKGLAVELNSIGDKDSILAYERELANALKKHADLIGAEEKKSLKGNLFDSFDVLKGSPALAHLPASIASLSTLSRAHFKDVLEHVEALGTGFRLAPELLGNRHYASETVFRIADEGGQTLASGTRYSRLTKRAGFKKEAPFAAVSVFPDLKNMKTYKEVPKPKFSLIQLGSTARMKALPLLEVLRRERIAVHQSLGRDKLSPQLELADEMKVPYLLIIGQKEALEDSVTVRNVLTRAQSTVPVAVLPEYLRHIAL